MIATCQRATDLIRAQYTDNLAEVKKFHPEVWVDFFDRAAFKPEYISTNPWFRQWHRKIFAMLEQEVTLFLVNARALFLFWRLRLICTTGRMYAKSRK